MHILADGLLQYVEAVTAGGANFLVLHGLLGRHVDRGLVLLLLNVYLCGCNV
jgi:hypothetical protein